jgi:hypothetical protein
MLVLDAVALHACPHESGGAEEFISADVAFPESMPKREDVFHFLEYVPHQCLMF